MELKVFLAEINPDPDSDLEVNFIGLVERPAIEKNFLAFNKENHLKFSLNEEKRIISGPAMIAGLPLYRKDDQYGEYFVVFTKETIRCIVEKFHAKGYMKNFNLFHDEDSKVDDIKVYNSFITDEDLGITAPKGFEDIPDGSWFITAKVNNDKVWEKVKSGDIKGFSVEGLFTYVQTPVSVKMTAEEKVRRIQEILAYEEI